MLTLAAEATIKASAPVVWQALTDFGGYPRWTGAATLDRAVERPDEVTYAIRVTTRTGGVKPWTFVGRLRSLEPPQRLAWTAGIPGILALAMSFELTARDGQTEVRHAARLSGVVPMLRPALVRRILQPVLDRLLHDLESEARRRERRGGGRIPVPGPARGGGSKRRGRRGR